MSGHCKPTWRTNGLGIEADLLGARWPVSRVFAGRRGCNVLQGEEAGAKIAGFAFLALNRTQLVGQRAVGLAAAGAGRQFADSVLWVAGSRCARRPRGAGCQQGPRQSHHLIRKRGSVSGGGPGRRGRRELGPL